MKPWDVLGRARTPDGGDMCLRVRDDEYVIAVGGDTLMSSRTHGSEDALADVGCRHLQAARRPRVLVGGLGMGFTLRASLDRLPADAVVTVAEIVPAVVAWNRGSLGPLAGHPLNDPRVRVEVRDVARTLRGARGRFDAILLDVDNGPAAFISSGNDTIYDDGGVASMFTALKQDGVLALWSAWQDRAFERRLARAGFATRVERVRARGRTSGAHHTIIAGVKRMRASASPGGR